MDIHNSELGQSRDLRDVPLENLSPTELADAMSRIGASSPLSAAIAGLVYCAVAEEQIIAAVELSNLQTEEWTDAGIRAGVIS